jgi:hypothetical protein
MDLGFIRRHRAAAIDLSALLARTATVQSTTPTARAQVRLDNAAGRIHIDDPHVALFAADEDGAPGAEPVASFAELPVRIFRPRQ